MLRILVTVMAIGLPSFASAEGTVFTVEGGQVSIPVGLTVQVKSVTVGADATTVRILASLTAEKPATST